MAGEPHSPRLAHHRRARAARPDDGRVRPAEPQWHELGLRKLSRRVKQLTALRGRIAPGVKRTLTAIGLKQAVPIARRRRNGASGGLGARSMAMRGLALV